MKESTQKSVEKRGTIAEVIKVLVTAVEYYGNPYRPQNLQQQRLRLHQQHLPGLLWLVLVEEGGGMAVDFLFHFVGIQTVVLKDLPQVGIVVGGAIPGS
ncbi:MAG: hypothetical protein ACK4E0_19020 [Chitinophagaceae bacterium]